METRPLEVPVTTHPLFDFVLFWVCTHNFEGKDTNGNPPALSCTPLTGGRKERYSDCSEVALRSTELSPEPRQSRTSAYLLLAPGSWELRTGLLETYARILNSEHRKAPYARDTKDRSPCESRQRPCVAHERGEERQSTVQIWLRAQRQPRLEAPHEIAVGSDTNQGHARLGRVCGCVGV